VFGHQPVRSWAIASGSVVAVIGTFLPWLRSGAADRSSYEIFALVDRLGFSPDGLVGWALRLWPLVPLLFAIAAVLQWIPPRHPAIVVGRRAVPIGAAVYTGSVALAIRLAPEAGLFRYRFGTWTTLLGAAMVLAGAVVPLKPRGSDASAAS
jgi:hypothetical protein